MAKLTQNIRVKALVIVLVLCVLLVSKSDSVSGVTGELTSKVSASRITHDEQVILRVSAVYPYTPTDKSPRLAPMPDFSVTWLATSDDVHTVDSKMFVTKTFSYLLTPKRTGTFEVGSELKWKKRKWISMPGKKIEVLPKSSFYEKKNSLFIVSPGYSDFFIVAFVDTTNPYVGEQIIYTFQVNGRGKYNTQTKYTPPPIAGFKSLNIIPYDYKKKYLKSRDKIIALFPTKPGDLTIGQSKLTYTLRKGQFTEWGMLRSNTISIQVKPFPEENKPRSFTGAVGQYTISSRVDKTELEFGDALTVFVTVRGTGNLHLINSLTEPEMTEYKQYGSKTNELIREDGMVVHGSKTWEYTVIPETAGHTTIGSFSLPFFNPVDKRYYTISTQSLDIVVYAEDANAANVTGKGDRQTQALIRHIASDIRFIKPDKQILRNSGGYSYPSPIMLLFYILPAGVFVMSLAVKKRYSGHENTEIKRKKAVMKQARETLDKASQSLVSGNVKDYYRLLHECIISYIENVLDVETGALNSATVENIMINYGIPEELAGHIRKILETCDDVEFAPAVTDTYDHKSILDETYELLRKLEIILI